MNSKLGAIATVSLVMMACSGSGSDAPPAFAAADFDTPKPLALRANAVKADRHVSDTVSVGDGQLTLPIGSADPTGTNEAFVAKLVPGAVIAGDRDRSSPDLAHAKNPYGFLRRVIDVERAADHVVIHTQQAYLNELFREGDLVWDPKHPRASIFDGSNATSLKPQDEGEPQAEPSSASGEVDADTELEEDDEEKEENVAFRPIVSLSNSRVGMDVAFTGEIQIRELLGFPTGVERASARLDLDPVLSTEITYGVKAESTMSSFGGALYKQWESPSVPIPIGGPIPLTVRLSARVTCAVTVSGAIQATSRLWLRGHTAAGFTYDGGFDIHPVYDPPTLQAGQDFLGVTGEASLVAQCSIQGVIALLAFDAAGLQGAVGPFASLEADACVNDGAGGPSGGIAVWEQHGLEVDVGGRLQVPGLGEPSISKDIFGFQPLKSDPHYFVGDAKTCTPKEKDSCADKPNGLYCSELAPGSAYQCQTGTIAGGQQCLGQQRCVGSNGNGSIQCR